MTDTAEYSRDPNHPDEFQAVSAPSMASRIAASENLIGRMLNNAYRVESIIGTGGMGVVYRAMQITLGRPVAVKTILGQGDADDRSVSRFFREARLLSQLNHPNVIHVIDFGTSEPGPVHFMVMEFLAGQPLDAYVAASPQLPGEAIYELMAQLCAGVSAAHSAGIVHRDLKPSNVFLCMVSGTPVPMVKVLDFGLAKAAATKQGPTAVTHVGTMLGTPGYSSPEQIQGNPDSDPRSDVYGLGAILYYLVSGKAPYTGPTFQAVLAKQLTQPPEPFDPQTVPADRAAAFEPVIHKAMAINPADRHATPSEFMADLEKACRPGDTPSDRKTPSWVSRFASPATRADQSAAHGHPPPGWAGRVAAIAAAVGLVGGLAGWLIFGGKPAVPVGPNGGGAAIVPAGEPGELVFGMSGPFSGPSRELGNGMKIGLDLAFDSANDAGGVHGRTLRLEARDDGYEPDRAVANAKDLIEKVRVFGFAGNVGTPTSEKVEPLAVEARKVFFAPYTGAQFLRKVPPTRYAFNYRASYEEETDKIVHYLVKERMLKPDQIAVFSQRDAYGDAGFRGVAKALRSLGFDPEGTLHVRYERNTTDIGDAVGKILANRDRVKAVVMVASHKPASLFIRRMKDEKVDAILTNVSFVNGTALAEALKDAGPHYADGVIVTQVVPFPKSHSTAVLRYRDLLKKYHPEQQPGFVSLEGYLAGLILIEGLKKAGPNPTTESLADGLEAIRNFDIGIGKPISFTPSDHQASHIVWGTVLDGEGEFKELELD